MRQSRREVLAGLIRTLAMASVPAWAHESAGHAAPPAAGKGRAPGRDRLATSAAVDPQGRLWVARVEHAGASDTSALASNIVLCWTMDDGRSWSPEQRVLRVPEPVEANGEGRPKLAFGPVGQLYLSFTRPLAKPHTGDIRFVRSADGGQSFSEPVTVQHDRAITGHRFDSMIVDRHGRIFIAWIDKRDGDGARAAKRPYRGAAIYYAVSVDDGKSFGPDLKVADHCCECCRIALSLNEDGEVVAMWRHIFEPNERDHAVAVLPVPGAPAVTVLPVSGAPAVPLRATFDRWRIDACPHHGPSLTFDHAGRRHQVWFSAGSDDGGLFYAATDSAGRLAEPLRLGALSAEHGEVATSGASICLVWKEFDGQTTSVFARQSGDSGASWQDRRLAASRGGSDHPHLVRSSQHIWLVWQTELDALIVRRLAGRS